MSGTTEIEKKSLEAHVELCAERYNALEDKMETMTVNISHLCDLVQEVKSTINDLNEKSTDRMIAWGIGIIGTLGGMLLGLLIAFNIDVIVPALETLFRASFLPKDIYLISRMPSDPQMSDILPVVLISLVLSFVATLYPSWRASQVNPAEALRYE